MDISILPLGIIPAHRPARIACTPEQIKYVQLKLTTKLNNVQIAKQLGVHFNTISNWNKSLIVQKEINEQVEEVRKDNLIGMQRLMASLIRESVEVLDDKEVSNSVKIQIIGQLFGQVGKFAGLEPVKQVQKQVNVVKTFEQLIDAEISENNE